MVPEKYIKWDKMIYYEANSHVQTAAGRSKVFRIKVGVHQGSALSLSLAFHYNDGRSNGGLQKAPPWTPHYVDDKLDGREQGST
ncbi:unnamed protein product [Strongylus vulgaris]|uniref:Reverse transcriptase domain-containing protein n=1 Tax=Strongylus vulgaris TaxID=40348 RepID=A0A3P7I4U1_STRVU|nr:unnamed protein product [Strongylus vulgaris]